MNWNQQGYSISNIKYMRQFYLTFPIGHSLSGLQDKWIFTYVIILDDSKNIFASKYQFYFPTEDELIEELEREKLSLELEYND